MLNWTTNVLQEHMLYISLVGELEESIRSRISQKLIELVSQNCCYCCVTACRMMMHSSRHLDCAQRMYVLSITLDHAC